MNEYTTVWQAFIALIGVSVASLLYALGGRSGKWQRRFIGSLVLACTVNGIMVWRGNWFPWALAVYPALIVGFSMGYGGDSTLWKVIRRSIYAAGIISSGLIFCLIMGGKAWLLFAPHVGVGLWSIWLGVKNPTEAAAEETLVCTLMNVCLVFYPFVVQT